MNNTPIRVLLVDDEEELVEFLAKRLARKGLLVEAVTSGRVALEKLQDHTFDVAVLDLKMPEMDGLQVLKALKKEAPFTQAIMLTGHGSIDLALESGRHDAYRFLSKPAEFDELLAVIQEAHAGRRKLLRDTFEEELNNLMTGSTSPHEILHETKRLRTLYEQD